MATTVPINRYERALVFLLRFEAFLLLTALFPSVMPFAWMQSIHRSLGMGELPDLPVLGYLTRSLSLMYAMFGAILMFVSLDVRRHLPVARFLATLAILFALGMTVLDITVGMPLFWTVCEGPFVFSLYCAIFWLTGRIRAQVQTTAVDSR